MGGLGGAPAGSQTRTGGPLAGGWHRRELTPEEIAEQNDFFRAWIEEVVVSPARRRGRPRKDAPSDVPDRVRIVWR
jgi:hypothetical protein